jgi:hypothetical protein
VHQAVMFPHMSDKQWRTLLIGFGSYLLAKVSVWLLFAMYLLWTHQASLDSVLK